LQISKGLFPSNLPSFSTITPLPKEFDISKNVIRAKKIFVRLEGLLTIA